MATSKQIRISITSALNAAGIEATKDQVNSMAQSVAKSMGDAAQKNQVKFCPIPKRAPWFKLVWKPKIFGMTQSTSLSPGSPRRAKRRCFVQRSLASATAATAVKRIRARSRRG